MTLNVLGQDGPVLFLFVARLRRAVCPCLAGSVPSVSAPSLGGVFLQQAFLTGRCSRLGVNRNCRGHRRFVSSVGTLSVFCVSGASSLCLCHPRLHSPSAIPVPSGFSGRGSRALIGTGFLRPPSPPCPLCHPVPAESSIPPVGNPTSPTGGRYAAGAVRHRAGGRSHRLTERASVLSARGGGE